MAGSITVLTLIPKQGSSLLETRNYRPISLLNLDYKILTKILVNRIKKILGRIINEDQSGFLPG